MDGIENLLKNKDLLELLQNENMGEIMKGNISQDLIEKLMKNDEFKDVINNVNKDVEELPELDLDDSKELDFYAEDKIVTQNLKNETYNNREGVIDDYDCDRDRYIVNIDGKLLAIKKENIQLINETIENID